jgi:hypothetical protein
MPTVLRVGHSGSIFIQMKGMNHPTIHVAKDDMEVKYWLNPVSFASNKGFKSVDLKKIERLVFENHSLLLEKYNEFHNF